MKRSKRLRVVQSVAAHEELEERKVMANSQGRLNTTSVRLGELKAYRNHYAANQRPASGAGGLQWQDYHNFMQRLDDAVLEQEKVVGAGRIQREAHRKHWMRKRRRLKSLSRVIDRFKTEETEAEERRLQKQQDAMAGRPSPFEREH